MFDVRVEQEEKRKEGTPSKSSGYSAVRLAHPAERREGQMFDVRVEQEEKRKEGTPSKSSGYSAVRLAHLFWEQGAAGSNPATPTKDKSRCVLQRDFYDLQGVHIVF
jgi:hypothetical protein